MQMYQEGPEDREGASRIEQGAGSDCHLRQVSRADKTQDVKEVQVRSQTQTVDAT
jgi:hypothetical protein